MCCFTPNLPYNGIFCYFTGWFGARWYRALDIDPPRIHPCAACIHGVASSAIAQATCYLLDKSPFKVTDPLKAKIVEVNAWVFGVMAARLLANYLNLNVTIQVSPAA